MLRRTSIFLSLLLLGARCCYAQFGFTEASSSCSEDEVSQLNECWALLESEAECTIGTCARCSLNEAFADCIPACACGQQEIVEAYRIINGQICGLADCQPLRCGELSSERTYFERGWNQHGQELELGFKPAPRYSAAMAGSEEKIYLHGGVVNGANTPNGCEITLSSELWEYDACQRAWTDLTVPADTNCAGESCVPPPIRGHCMAFDASSGTLILFGGTTSDGVVEDFWTFRVSSKTWESGRSGFARSGHGCAVVRLTGAFYAFGGHDGEGHSAALLRWNINSNEWTELSLGEHPSPRSNMGLGILGSNLVLLQGEGENEAVQADMWRFSGGVSWTQLAYDSGDGRTMVPVRGSSDGAPVPARSAFSFTGIESRGVLVSFGGRAAGGGLLSDLREFDDAKQLWSDRTLLGGPVPAREHHAAAVAGTSLFVFGGLDGDRCRPLGDLWEARLPEAPHGTNLSSSCRNALEQSARTGSSAVCADFNCDTCGYLGWDGELNCIACQDGFEIEVVYQDCTGRCVPEGTSNILLEDSDCIPPLLSQCVYPGKIAYAAGRAPQWAFALAALAVGLLLGAH